MSEPAQKKSKAGYKQTSLLSFFSQPQRSSGTQSQSRSENFSQESCNMSQSESQDSDIICLDRPGEPATSSKDKIMSAKVAPVSAEATIPYSDSQSITESQSSTENEDLGFSFAELRRFPEISDTRTGKRSTATHTVFVKSPTVADQVPQPFLDGSFPKDVWDSTHVRLPCSPENVYPNGGSGVLTRRWELIEGALLSGISSSYDLEKAILKYNQRYTGKWDFSNLHAVINKGLTGAERQDFFANVLPCIVQLTLNLPNLICIGIPLLKTGSSRSLTFSQQQIASLLANAFFCTFPRRNATHPGTEFAHYPTINMNGLFASSERQSRGKNRDKSMQQKIRCLIHYFTRISKHMPTGCVTFKRKLLDGLTRTQWSESKAPLPNCHFSSKGLIEDADGCIQVDFANRRIGGGAIKTGCVQEEIQFFLHPELIISRLFTEQFSDNEVMVIKGVERFCGYTGYADTFEFAGDYQDELPFDSMGRRYRRIVAMDATRYGNTLEQYSENSVLREINKAYCGYHTKKPMPVAIATGNWGCGAYRGNHKLKALIQILAAGQCRRQISYSAFNDTRLKHDLAEFHEFCTAKNLTVGELWHYIVKYNSDVVANVRKASFLKTDIHSFIRHQVSNKK